MNFIHPKIQEYSDRISAQEPELLQALNQETHLKVLYPRMLSGHWQGRFLSFFSKMLTPQHVLEIGTYTGYSCLCMAEGLSKNGNIITIEKNPELRAMFEKYISEAGLEDKITLLNGDASAIIPELKETFDLVFLDADKDNYLHYYEMVLPKVRSGGVILADNVLWSGKVTEEAKPNDKETIAIKQFNEFVAHDERVECLLLPVRDGLLWIVKK